MTFRPVLATWNDADLSFKVVARFGRLARSQFSNGEDYPLEVVEHRSSAEHNHYFAAIKNAWDNVNDEETIRLLGGPNGLRHWALIQTGWCYTVPIGPMSKAAAIKGAHGAADNFRRWSDEMNSSKQGGSYVEVVIRPVDGGWVVIVKTPMSQSRAAMKKEPFRDSKKAVLELLAGQIQVKRRELEQSGKDAA